MAHGTGPTGLSPGSAGVWAALTTGYAFAAPELELLERALRWFDRADGLCQAADAATDARERAGLLKQGMDAATTGLRFWRQLRFTDGSLARRPGRPAGPDWSPKRRRLSLQAG
jgi:hypothetical protein